MSAVNDLFEEDAIQCPQCAINRPGRRALVTRVRIPDAVGSFWWCQTCGAELDDADLDKKRG